MNTTISFESACEHYEQFLKEFSNILTSGSIPKLKDTQWIYEKKQINVYPADESGRKMRGAQGPTYRLHISLNRKDAEMVWEKFNYFAKEQDLNIIERVRNNENELGWYDYRATNNSTDDEFSCAIKLPNDWNQVPVLQFRMFIGPRYRKNDI